MLTRYDVNKDGFVQEPELVVLYIREAAIGLGHAVDFVGVNPRADTLVLPGAEISGLVQFIENNSARMTPNAQAMFKDLVFLGQQVLIDTSIVRDTSL